VSGAPSVVAVERRGGAGGNGFCFFLQPDELAIKSPAIAIAVTKESFGACKGRAITSP
jgi:hypothetical protein